MTNPKLHILELNATCIQILEGHYCASTKYEKYIGKRYDFIQTESIQLSNYTKINIQIRNNIDKKYKQLILFNHHFNSGILEVKESVDATRKVYYDIENICRSYKPNLRKQHYEISMPKAHKNRKQKNMQIMFEGLAHAQQDNQSLCKEPIYTLYKSQPFYLNHCIPCRQIGKELNHRIMNIFYSQQYYNNYRFQRYLYILLRLKIQDCDPLGKHKYFFEQVIFCILQLQTHISYSAFQIIIRFLKYDHILLIRKDKRKQNEYRAILFKKYQNIYQGMALFYIQILKHILSKNTYDRVLYILQYLVKIRSKQYILFIMRAIFILYILKIQTLILQFDYSFYIFAQMLQILFPQQHICWIIIKFKSVEKLLQSKMNTKNIKFNNSKQNSQITLKKSKSSSIFQLKQLESQPNTLTSLQSINSKKSTHRGEENKNLFFNKYEQLPIYSQIYQPSVYHQYYSPSSEILGKKVSFAEDKSKIIGSPQPPQTKKRVNSILKNGSISKKSRSKSNTSIRLNTSIQKDSKLCFGGQQANFSVVNKFKNLLKQYQAKKSKQKIYDKFTDSMFPPIYSSLFTVQKNQNQNKRIGNEIIWKRLSDLFKNKKIVLKNQQKQNNQMYLKVGKYASQYFIDAINIVKQSNLLVYEFIKDHIHNDFGIYCIKIFTQNGWRHIIIDDFIPVIKIEDKNQYIPAFINITSFEEQHYRTKNIQIWPYLLEKAYASYYCTYESLKYGKLIDFLQEISGTIVQQPKQNNKIKVPFKRLNFKISKIIPSKQISKKPRPDIFLRKIVIGTQQNINIMIRQKDERFYHHSALYYTYIWNRAILVYKQYNSNYMWIDGFYSNKKSINFKLNARPGDYYLIVMPEWRQVHRHNISVIISSESQIFDIQTMPYDYKQRILEKGCSDLAQREGQLKQINKISCSYQYVHQNCGLDIESIHNERINGQIAIQRQWKGKSKTLIPFNIQFGQYNEKKIIQVLIEKNGQFTLVIMEINGKNNSLKYKI